MSVQENLEMGACTLKDRDEVKEKVKEVYQRFPFLKSKKDQKARSLSGGM